MRNEKLIDYSIFTRGSYTFEVICFYFSLVNVILVFEERGGGLVWFSAVLFYEDYDLT